MGSWSSHKVIAMKAMDVLSCTSDSCPMANRIEDLLSSCSKIDFGCVVLSEEEKEFCSELNDEVISLCESLPKSTQTDALLLFMRYFRIPFGQEFSLFSNYYAPSWSIIYWLIQVGLESKGLEKEDIQNARSAHSMALLLHPLDDHLNDNEWPATHLFLLLRSQSWMIMNNAWNRLADKIDGGEEIVAGFVDDYYAGIRSSKEILSLDSYCDLFRKQMATGFIVPALILKKMTTNEEFARAIQTAYGSFGIAWRLLDDINDIETDMMKSVHSSIYISLSENIKNYWDKNTEDINSDHIKVILDYILKNGVIDRIKERICSELDSAASMADDYKMASLADEFRCLLRPLRDTQDELWTGALKQKGILAS